MTDNLPTTINWESELKGASMLVKSGLVPKDIRSDEAALFVILAGRDLGLSAVQSLRSIRPIQGKIECSADLQLGLFHRDGGRSRFIKLDKDGAHLELTAKWLTEPHVSKFGTEDAKRANLMSNSNYTKYPQAMFRSRAITQGLKDIGYMMGSGVYAPGEIGGSVVIDSQTGEVLPGEDAPQVGGTVEGSDSTSGAVEALPDTERENILADALTITTDMGSEQTSSAALTMYHSYDADADKKVALWAMLDRPTKKALREADKAAKAGPAPTVDDAIAAVKAGDYDAAADLSRSLSERDKRFIEDEIKAATEAA